jgi:hypothetical protein
MDTIMIQMKEDDHNLLINKKVHVNNLIERMRFKIIDMDIIHDNDTNKMNYRTSVATWIKPNYPADLFNLGIVLY